MSEKPILFSTEMVRAILDGRKTQTRRVAKLNASGRVELHGRNWHVDDKNAVNACPYGQAGDLLWVRETWRKCAVPQCGDSLCFEYKATDYCKSGHLTTLNRTGWKPSIFMPREACRLILRITDVRIERLNDITDADSVREGVVGGTHGGAAANINGKIHILPHEPVPSTYGEWRNLQAFRGLWDSINAKRGFGWDANPWVWVISFEVNQNA